MDVNVLWAIRDYQGLDTLAGSILLRIELHANKEGNSSPGVPLLAKEVGKDERSVQRAISALEKDGFVTSQARSGGRGIRTIYRTCPSRLLAPPPPLKPRKPRTKKTQELIGAGARSTGNGNQYHSQEELDAMRIIAKAKAQRAKAERG